MFQVRALHEIAIIYLLSPLCGRYFFSANIKIMPLNSQDIFVNYVVHNLFSYEEIVADKSLINF